MAHVNVALIGYAFMGRAHSNAWRQVARFFTPKLTPRMKVICGRRREERQGSRRIASGGTRPRPTGATSSTGRTSTSSTSARRATATRRSRLPRPKRARWSSARSRSRTRCREAQQMLAAVQKAGVIHMICHNYRRAPAVMLARQLIDEGKLGRLYHYRGTYLQDWVADPSVPLYWRLQKDKAGSGALGDIASHSLDLARFLVGEITEVTAALETFVKERPLPDNPKKKGPVTVDDASASIVRFDNGALGTIEAIAVRDRPQELQPLRDQRQQGLGGVRHGTHERARGLPDRRRQVGAGLPYRDGHRAAPPVLQGVVAGRATSSATSTRSSTPSTICCRRSRPTSCRRRTSRTACRISGCWRRWRSRRERSGG